MTVDERREEQFKLTVFKRCGYDISNRKLDEKTRLLRSVVIDNEPAVSLCAQCLLKQYTLDYG